MLYVNYPPSYQDASRQLIISRVKNSLPSGFSSVHSIFSFFFGTEKKAKELVLSSGAVESLQSRTDALSVVDQILDKLQLSQEALTNPVPETTRVVRCLARIAKRENRTDVVKHLRKITSAGTAGILFITSLLTIIQDLTPFSLCVVEKKIQPS